MIKQKRCTFPHELEGGFILQQIKLLFFLQKILVATICLYQYSLLTLRSMYCLENGSSLLLYPIFGQTLLLVHSGLSSRKKIRSFKLKFSFRKLFNSSSNSRKDRPLSCPCLAVLQNIQKNYSTET